MAHIVYTPQGSLGYRVELATDDGHILTIVGDAGEGEIDKLRGDSELAENPSVVTNLVGYATQEQQRRRARADDKRKLHEGQAKAHYKMATFIAELVVRGEGEVSNGWCSGCFTKSDHVLVGGSKSGVHLCRGCGAPTARCAVPKCSNHANRGVRPVSGPRYCAEHCHDIPSFARASGRLTDLGEYDEWLRFEKRNYRKVTRMAALSVVGGAVVGPLAWVSAPAIGGAVGAMGGLSGAAATSHGLATLGFGSLAAGGLGMAGGTAIITATGTALGGALGGVMTAAYVTSDKSFKIVKLRDGVGAPVIVASGFLTEGTGHWGTWRRLIDGRFLEHPVYRLHWGSKELSDLFPTVSGGAGRHAARKFFEGAAKKAAKGASLGPLGAALGAFDFGKNPWSVAKNRAAMTGAVLADLIARSDEGPYILVGHSLGARVMATAADALGSRTDDDTSPRLVEVHLLGAAIGHKGPWKALNDSVAGTVYNYWSTNDSVLRRAYSTAQLGQKAAGAVGLAGSWPRIANRDVSRQIKRHSDYFTAMRLASPRSS